MKTTLHSRPQPSAGYALLMVLAFCAISSLIVASSVQRTISNGKLNERDNTYTVNLSAAEAATEKVIARMTLDYWVGAQSQVTANLSSYRTSVPASSEDSYWSDFEFSNGQGTAGQTYVQLTSNQTYKVLTGQYAGLSGWSTGYRVLSNVRQPNGRYPDLITAVQQDIELNAIPVFQFAIFYNSLLEFTWAAEFVIRGRVHANSNIYVGSSANLSFSNTVTTTGFITNAAWFGKNKSQYSGWIKYAGNPPSTWNVGSLSLPIGINNTANAVREIINIPPSGEDVNSSMGQERYYNKAGMVLLVSNDVVKAIIKSAPDDASPTVLTSSNTPALLAITFPFLTNTYVFRDQRENTWMKTSQIDMGRLKTWSETSPEILIKRPAGNPFNILYVADFRSVNATTNTAVRLVNGRTLPAGNGTGFTVATINPLYIQGHYNVTNNSHLGTTNTSSTVPASVVSDALTILSPNWQDSLSNGSFTSRDAVSTTINAALITGVVFSTGNGTTTFSGGAQNITRLLEDWGNGSASIVLTLNTSIVNLFNSVSATAQFKAPGAYYYAPRRNFNYDNNFNDPNKLPPGTPRLQVLVRSKWAVPPPNTVNYAGN